MHLSQLCICADAEFVSGCDACAGAEMCAGDEAMAATDAEIVVAAAVTAVAAAAAAAATVAAATVAGRTWCSIPSSSVMHEMYCSSLKSLDFLSKCILICVRIPLWNNNKHRSSRRFYLIVIFLMSNWANDRRTNRNVFPLYRQMEHRNDFTFACVSRWRRASAEFELTTSQMGHLNRFCAGGHDCTWSWIVLHLVHFSLVICW